MKLLNDLKLQFEKELWALSPELAVMDTILNQHPEIYEMVKKDIMIGEKSSSFGRRDRGSLGEITYWVKGDFMNGPLSEPPLLITIC